MIYEAFPSVSNTCEVLQDQILEFYSLFPRRNHRTREWLIVWECGTLFLGIRNSLWLQDFFEHLKEKQNF